MIEIKKEQIEETLLTIAAYNKDNRQIIYGLLSEDISLGTKRKLQKIQKFLIKEYSQFIEDKQEILKEFEDQKENIEKELKELHDEKIFIPEEFVSIEAIENIKSKNNYNFEIIELFAK